MMRKMVSFFCMAIMATASYAGIGISWNTINGVAWHGAAQSVLDGSFESGESLLDRYSAIWQLIYAGADNAIDDPSMVAGGANGDYVTDDDVVWAERIIPQGGNAGGTPCDDGTTWNSWLTQDTVMSTAFYDAAWTASAFVYQRVFEGTPSGGSWYYQSGLVSVPQWPGSPAAETEAWLDTNDNLVQPTYQMIPEPATMGLLGLGALVMAIRRRRA